MGTTQAGKESVRTLVKAGSVSYTVTLPIEGVRKLRWQEGQRLVVELDEKNKQFVLRDWKK